MMTEDLIPRGMTYTVSARRNSGGWRSVLPPVQSGRAAWLARICPAQAIRLARSGAPCRARGFRPARPGASHCPRSQSCLQQVLPPSVSLTPRGIFYSGTRIFDKSGVACYAPPACIRLPRPSQHGGLPCPENVELLRPASKATSSLRPSRERRSSASWQWRTGSSLAFYVPGKANSSRRLPLYLRLPAKTPPEKSLKLNEKKLHLLKR